MKVRHASLPRPSPLCKSLVFLVNELQWNAGAYSRLPDDPPSSPSIQSLSHLSPDTLSLLCSLWCPSLHSSSLSSTIALFSSQRTMPSTINFDCDAPYWPRPSTCPLLVQTGNDSELISDVLSNATFPSFLLNSSPMFSVHNLFICPVPPPPFPTFSCKTTPLPLALYHKSPPNR